MDCSPTDSSVWNFPGKNTRVGCISSSRESSQFRDQTSVSCVFCFGRQVLYHCTTWEAHNGWYFHQHYIIKLMYHERFLTRRKSLTQENPALKHLIWTIWTLNSQWLCPWSCWVATTGESPWDGAQGINKQNKCLPAFYVLGLLNSSVFIDLAQIDQWFTGDLNCALLYIKLI